MNAAVSVAPSIIPLKGLRGSIARSMTAGWQAPRVALGMEVDMTRCLQLCAELQQASGADKRFSVTPLVLRAVALSLRKYPYMNALMTADGIEQKPDIHVGLAVALEDGLAVPVIRDADTKSIPALAAESGQSAGAARAGTLPLKAYQGGTFTVTNLGMAGVDWFTPILNPPQVGILGLSRVAEKAVVRDGLIAIAPMTTLTLVFDHRAVDGYPAALFLKDLKARLESCENL
jgi:pyruvate/2-oxoglutarate dehydrogenase complex dihydrolipoamide acyltransferase (E2) component